MLDDVVYKEWEAWRAIWETIQKLTGLTQEQTEHKDWFALRDAILTWYEANKKLEMAKERQAEIEFESRS